MTRNELIDEYFDWMYRLVCDKQYTRNKSYTKLLSYLYDTNFFYLIDRDGNRADDGIQLRYRFGYESGYDDRVIASYLDDRDCSVLEMMVALAMRCEEHIMGDPDMGDRMGQWFWSMIDNLGLMEMDNKRFNEAYAEVVIDIFLNREYKPNGEGGLFTVEDRNRDLRSVEIWYQMMWYLDSILNI